EGTCPPASSPRPALCSSTRWCSTRYGASDPRDCPIPAHHLAATALSREPAREHPDTPWQPGGRVDHGSAWRAPGLTLTPWFAPGCREDAGSARGAQRWRGGAARLTRRTCQLTWHLEPWPGFWHPGPPGTGGWQGWTWKRLEECSTRGCRWRPPKGSALPSFLAATDNLPPPLHVLTDQRRHP